MTRLEARGAGGMTQGCHRRWQKLGRKPRRPDGGGERSKCAVGRRRRATSGLSPMRLPRRRADRRAMEARPSAADGRGRRWRRFQDARRQCDFAGRPASGSVLAVFSGGAQGLFVPR